MSAINDKKKITGGTTYAVASSGVTVAGQVKEYATYQKMLSDAHPYSFAYVKDASGDPTVNSGAAIYAYKGGSWKKLYEAESMDQDITANIGWDNIKNKPTSSPDGIDDAVRKKHSHSNLEILNKLSTNEKGELVFNDHLVNDNENIKVTKYIQLVCRAEEPVHLELNFYSDAAMTRKVASPISSRYSDSASLLMYFDGTKFTSVSAETGIPVEARGRFVIADIADRLNQVPTFIKWTWSTIDENVISSGGCVYPSMTPVNNESIGFVWNQID